MAAQAVRYFNGSSKSLTKALLSQLFKGVAHISLMPYDSTNGVSWANLSFNGADEIFTIKDSFQIAQADPTNTEIKIDQKDATIDTVTEAGEWTFNGNIPTVAADLAKVFYNHGVDVAGASAPILGQEGTTYSGVSFFAEPKEVYATMMVENSAQNLAVAFARVKIVVGMSKDDNTNPLYLKMSGSILANTEATGLQGDWAYCEKYSAA